jgi:YVTN family beta-propeller protein
VKNISYLTALLAATALVNVQSAFAGQAPGAASDPDIPISHRDRVYAAEQFSNTVSVTDPADNKLLGVIRLGDPTPGNFSPLYRGQLLVHGMGFSPDHRTIAVVSIGSNSVTFIDTATNAVKHTTYVGRSPHEAFFTPDGKEVWVTVRGENYVSVLDGTTYEEKTRIIVPGGPGMQIFSPDGKFGYVCSSFNPETVVITVADHQIVRPGRCRHPGTAGARRRRASHTSHSRACGEPQSDGRGEGPHEHFAIRPGVVAGAAGFGHWARAEAALRACALAKTGWWRRPRAAGGIHDESRGLSDRQRRWADPSARPKRGGRAQPLSGHRTGVGDATGQAGAGAGGVSDDGPR